VQGELAKFLGDTPPADDCTLLAVRRPARASQLRSGSP
jgi:hypothetical protein